MTTLARLRRTLGVATDLSGVVRTMKTMAAVNIRQFEASAAAIDEYVTTVEAALSVALRTVGLPEPRPVVAVGRIVLGSDQGLCGGFNERLTAGTVEALGRAPGPIVAVGHRVARRLEAEGIDPELEFRTPGAVAGITDLVIELLEVCGAWQDAGHIDAIELIHNRPDAHGALRAVVVQLLPLDPTWLARLAERPWPTRSLPGSPHDPDRLFRWLVREWLFARLYLSCAVSLAAENSARLYATQAAERALDERVRDLRVRYRNERQQAITEELLDLHR